MEQTAKNFCIGFGVVLVLPLVLFSIFILVSYLKCRYSRCEIVKVKRCRCKEVDRSEEDVTTTEESIEKTFTNRPNNGSKESEEIYE